MVFIAWNLNLSSNKLRLWQWIPSQLMKGVWVGVRRGLVWFNWIYCICCQYAITPPPHPTPTPQGDSWLTRVTGRPWEIRPARPTCPLYSDTHAPLTHAGPPVPLRRPTCPLTQAHLSPLLRPTCPPYSCRPTCPLTQAHLSPYRGPPASLLKPSCLLTQAPHAPLLRPTCPLTQTHLSS